MATSNWRRWPTAATPSSLRSSAVRWHNTSALTPFSRNAASYWSRPKLLSHAPTSPAVSSGLVMLAADYARGVLLLSRQRDAVEVLQFRLTAGNKLGYDVSILQDYVLLYRCQDNRLI